MYFDDKTWVTNNCEFEKDPFLQYMPVLRRHCIPGKAWMAFWNTISAAFPSKNSVVTGTSSFYVRCKKRCVFLNVVNTIYTVWMNSSVNKLIRIYKARVVPNSFIPQSDQLQISPAALLEILHHTVWKGCDKNPCLIAWGKWVLVWGKQVSLATCPPGK